MLNVAHKHGFNHINGRSQHPRQRQPPSSPSGPNTKRRRLGEPRSLTSFSENEPQRPIFNTGSPKYAGDHNTPSRLTKKEPSMVVDLINDSPESPVRGASLGYVREETPMHSVTQHPLPVGYYKSPAKKAYMDAEDAFNMKCRADFPKTMLGLFSTCNSYSQLDHLFKPTTT